MKSISNKVLLSLSIGIALMPFDTLALDKKETVYTNLNYDGSVEYTTVSNHLSFIGDTNIDDMTELKNILNINGDEAFTKDENGITWENKGRDILYRGSTDKSLPIRTQIKYYLNGEEKNIDEMIGKSGKITIEYTFNNDQKNYVSINGKMETLYTPFVTMVASVLKSDCKNISIENGKIVSTGSRTMVVGLSSPGLYHSTKIEGFKNLDTVTLNFETESFELGTTYIVSTPKILSEADIDILSKIDSTYDSVDLLKSNMITIENGAKELETGAQSLFDGSNTLTNSLRQVSESSKQLRNGSKTINVALDEMIKSLNIAKDELSIQNGQSSLDNISKLKNMNTSTLNSLMVGIEAQGITEERLSQACSDSTQTDPLLGDEHVRMACLLKMNNRTLDESIEIYKKTSAMLNAKLDALLSGLIELRSGTGNLDNGITSMSTGLNKIYIGSQNLSEGSQKLKIGATNLSGGTTMFREQGIEKIVDLANSVKAYSDRAKALKKFSQSYDGYSSNNADETVFVSMINSYRK